MLYIKKLDGAPKNYALKIDGVLTEITREGLWVEDDQPGLVDPWIEVSEEGPEPPKAKPAAKKKAKKKAAKKKAKKK